MQKIRSISQKFTEILRFENSWIKRYCCTFGVKNRKSNLAKIFIFDIEEQSKNFKIVCVPV